MLKKLIERKFLFLILLAVSVAIVSYLSYGKALDYYFWRDDTFVIWASKYQPHVLEAEQFARNRLIGNQIYRAIYPGLIGYNIVYWQYSGLFLKIINSLLIFILFRTLFKDGLLAFLGALFYASYFGGLEAYSWSRLVAIEITFILLTFIFYVKSYIKGSYKYLVVSIVFSSFVMSIEIWRVVAILLILPAWEISNLLSNREVLKIKTTVIRLLIFLVANFLIFNMIIGGTGGSGSNSGLISGYSKVFMGSIQNGNWKNFASSVGNLVRSPYLTVNEEGGLTAGDALSLPFGILFILIFIFLLALFLWKKNKSLIIPLVGIFWIILFYIPNWLYESSLTIGASHRYIAISAVGFVLLLVYLVGKTKGNARLLIFFLLILLSLNGSRKIVENDYSIRGTKVVKPLLDKLIYTIPPGEKKSIIDVWGENKLRGYVFEWSGPYLYSYLRGIASYDDFPVFANSKTAALLLCDPNTQIIDWRTGMLKKSGETADISKLHGFYINSDNVMEDRTDTFMLDVAGKAPCLAKQQSKTITSNLTLRSTVFINNLGSKNTNKIGLILNWERSSAMKKSDYSYILYFNDKASNKTIAVTKSYVSFGVGDYSKSSTIVADFDQLFNTNENYVLKIKSCEGLCDLSDNITKTIQLDL